MPLNIRSFALAGGCGSHDIGDVEPSFATDIAWTWNNERDKDAKARFEDADEHIYAYEYEGNDYVDYAYGGNTGLRWYISGSEDKSQKDLNLSISEGLTFSMQVCEEKTGVPDDCSDWRSGKA